MKLVQAFVLERMHAPYIKHIEGRIWEVRLRKGRDRLGSAHNGDRAASGDPSRLYEEVAEAAASRD